MKRRRQPEDNAAILWLLGWLLVAIGFLALGVVSTHAAGCESAWRMP